MGDGAPARVADRASERPFKHVVAARAWRRQKRAHETIRGRRPQHHADMDVQGRGQRTLDGV